MGRNGWCWEAAGSCSLRLFVRSYCNVVVSVLVIVVVLLLYVVFRLCVLFVVVVGVVAFIDTSPITLLNIFYTHTFIAKQ